MAGYIRQSTFVDGDTITAALFNNEYNQLVNAFSNTSGHKHDGTTAEGPVIGLIGDAGETSPNNKVLIDTTNNYIEFYVEVSSAPVQQLYIADGAIIPVTDSDIDLGTTSLRFKDTYTDTVTTTGNVSIGGDLTVTGSATISGNLTFGDADTDSINLAAEIDSDIIPNTDGTYDLGSATKEWQDLYIDGTANIDSLVADTADINGGTIDGATIATSDITVGAGKTLNVSAGTLTLADNQISGDKVEGGTIAATTITTLTSTTGNITNVNATTLDTTNIEVTNLKAKDGTAAGSIANSTGVVTLASSVLTTTDINGGTIDGVTIGGTTAGAVTFTDLSDGTITIAGFADEDNMVSNSATLLPTQQSVKAYVDSQVTAQDLDFQGDTGGALSIDLDSESLTIAGGTGLDTVGSGNTVTVNIDSTVATLTGTQTLTNKILTSPDVNTPDIDGGTVDGTVIGGTTPAAGTFTTLTANTSITGTLATAAQPNITSVGTLTGLTGGTGDLNWDSGTLFVDSSANAVGIGTTSPDSSTKLNIQGTDGASGASTNVGANELFIDNNGNTGVTVGTSTTGTGYYAFADSDVALRSGLFYDHSTDDMGFRVASATAMTIDSSRNIGIGTTNPDEQLHISNALPAVIRLERNDTTISSGNTIGNIEFEHQESGGEGLCANFAVKADTGAGAGAFVFETGAAGTLTEKVRFTSEGNVGIGTTSPSSVLHLSTSNDPKITLTDTGFGASADITGSNGNLRLNSQTATIFDMADSEIARFDSSGNLGIGTSSPSEPLHISHASAGNAALRIDNTGDDVRAAFFSGTGYFGINALNVANTATKNIVLASNGSNVGIGTTSPSTTLAVINSTAPTFDNSTHAGESIFIRSGGSAGSGNVQAVLAFGKADGSSMRSGSAIASIQTDSDTDKIGLGFYTSGSSSSAQTLDQKMILTHGGNVGIGTSSPAKTLEVNAGTNTEMRIGTTTNGSLQLGHFANGTFIGTDSGTPSAADLVRLGTGGTERMRIDSSGNVGIGTSSIASGGANTQNVQIHNSTANSTYLKLSTSGTGATASDGLDLIMGNDGTAYVWNRENSNTIFATNNQERMRIDSSGNVGIGTTSPADKLHVAGAVFSTSNTVLTTTTGAIFDYNDGQDSGRLLAYKSTGSNLLFYTNPSSGSLTERMRIDSSGNVGIGTSSPSEKLHIRDSSTNADVYIKIANDSRDWFMGVEGSNSDILSFKTHDASNLLNITSSGNLLVGTTTSSGLLSLYNSGQTGLNINTPTGTNTFAAFQRNGSTVGSITTNGSTTSFNTSSDARLKDVTGEARGLEVINELNPVAYNWKADGQADEGLIAQEVMDIVPNAVSGSEEDYYQMDYSKLVVHLVAGMKEQQAQIEALQSEINLLKGE